MTFLGQIFNLFLRPLLISEVFTYCKIASLVVKTGLNGGRFLQPSLRGIIVVVKDNKKVDLVHSVPPSFMSLMSV